MYKCVCKYQTLTEKKLHITYGKKGVKTDVHLSFSYENFFHLSGMRYLMDLQNEFHNYDKADLFLKLLNDEEYCNKLLNSEFYSDISSRIELVSNLEEILSNDFDLFKADKYNLAKQNCQIPCEYIIRIKRNKQVAFLFLAKTGDTLYVANSIFYNKRQLVYGQRNLAILHKSFE